MSVPSEVEIPTLPEVAATVPPTLPELRERLGMLTHEEAHARIALLNVTSRHAFTSRQSLRSIQKDIADTQDRIAELEAAAIDSADELYERAVDEGRA